MSRIFALILTSMALLAAGSACAHFKLNLNVRIVHVEHRGDGLDVYIRLPMPYLVADKLGPVGEDGDPAPSPFTTNAREDGVLVHYLDPRQLADDPLGLGTIVAKGHLISAKGEALAAEVLGIRVYRRGEEPGFATLDEAKASLSSSQAALAGAVPYVGDTVVDTVIHYSSGVPVSTYRFQSTLDPGLPGQEDTANLVLDYGAGETKIFRARGLLADGVEVSRSTLSAIRTFINQGIRHILGGPDHVLFVLCLILGAGSLFGLIERVTGFTLGHTVTLILGFLGFVPKGAWFVPAVEMGIAITIVYAAWLVLRPREPGSADGWQMFAITGAIGLLHGLGFSFVLHEILQIDSPNLWQSLIAFNVGVEIGQLAIIVSVWPLLLLIRHFSATAWRYSQIAVASTCLLIAGYWIIERGGLLIPA